MDIDVKDLVARLEALESLTERLAAENEQLRAGAGERSVVYDDAPGQPRDPAVNRRQMFRKLGLAAAAGGAMAVGGSVLNATPAAAAPISGDSDTGDGVVGVSSSTNHSGVYGNNLGGGFGVTGRSSTGVAVQAIAAANNAVRALSNGTYPTVYADNLANGPGVTGGSEGGQGVYGVTNAISAAGVFGVNNADGPGVHGVAQGNGAGVRAQGGTVGLIATGSINAVRADSLAGHGVVGSTEATSDFESGVIGNAPNAVGVHAVGRIPLLVRPKPTSGPPTSGQNPKGALSTDVNGVLWMCTASGTPGTWVRTITSGENALTGTQQLTVRKSGTGAALYGQVDATTGTAWAVRGHTFGAAEAIYGSIANASNTKAALRGTTTGPGAAVRGDSDLGRGGQFKGKAAAINLTPNTDATHPSSGAAGDLFVDSSVRLWLCKGGTNWVRVAG